jgi:hypothetical protein
MTKESKEIEDKEAEIEHYRGCLERYGPGRWANAGKRHLEELQQELKDLRDHL